MAIAFSTTGSIASGSPGRACDGRGRGAFECANSVASSLSRGNGAWPVSAKWRTAPSA